MYKENTARPCDNCPLKPDGPAANKIIFSDDGEIYYFPVSEQQCGIAIKHLVGVQAEALRANMANCAGPDTHVSRNGILGKLGIKREIIEECPAFRWDPTSRRQLTDYLEGA